MERDVIFQFNNVGKPYLLVKVFSEDRLINKGAIEFEASSLVNGLPNYSDVYNKVDEFLKSKEANRNSALFLLNCSQSFKVTTQVPNINDKKARKLYETELANKVPNHDSYDVKTTECVSGNARVYYDFMLEKRYIEFFNKLVESLGFNKIDFDYYYNYLFNASKCETNTYAYFYEEKGVMSLVLSINGVLSAYSSFENTIENIRMNISSVIDRHVFEIEKVDIKTVIANKEIAGLDGIDITVRPFIIGE
ncbi:MAG: hypothetical protein KBT35_00985 [Firmicutes bacterium]|nr:hypothetical protein [Candidatus Colivicinus equi]